MFFSKGNQSIGIYSEPLPEGPHLPEGQLPSPEK